METYLITMNNLKRIFKNKSTYLMMALIPLLLTGIVMLGNRLSEKTMRVALLHPTVEIQEELSACPHVEYLVFGENAKGVKADYIMGKYHYVIDTDDREATKKALLEIKEKQSVSSSAMPPFKRFLASLLTAYFVIAAVYASKLIQEKNQGTWDRARTAGCGRGQLFLGYVFSTWMIVALQVTVAMLCFVCFERNNFLGGMKAAAMIMTISMIATIYGVLHACLCKREMTANIMASSIAVVCSILGGTFVSINQMPLVLQKLSVISPVRWVLELFF